MGFICVVDWCVCVLVNRGGVCCVVQLNFYIKDLSEDLCDIFEDLWGVFGEDVFVMDVEYQDREDYRYFVYCYNDCQVDFC